MSSDGAIPSAPAASSPGDANPPAGLGSVRPVRDLAPSAVGERWLALNEAEHTSHVIHVIRCAGDTEARVGEVLQRLKHATDPHVLRVDQVERRDDAWVVLTDYPGHSDGVITLHALLSAKGGKLTSPEAARGVRHLLDALLHTHKLGVTNGLLDKNQCLVDRHGRVVLELAGIRAAFEPGTSCAEHRRAEIRSLGQLSHQLFSGVQPGETRRPGTRIDATWERWMTRAIASLDGYSDVEQAAADYPAVPVRDP